MPRQGWAPPTTSTAPPLLSVQAVDGRERVSARLDALELSSFEEPLLLGRAAVDLLALAERRGWTDLAHRARLVHADVLGRDGDTAAMGVIARQVNDWASAHQHAHLLARSELLLSVFFGRIGDMPSALGHATRSVELLPADADPRLLASHLIGLATAYGRSRSYDVARERFIAIVDLADDLGDIPLRMAALNNLGYIECWAGRSEAAMRAADELVRTARQHDVPLDAGYLETVARARILAGDDGAAEHTLAAVFDPGPDGRLVEADELPEVLLTLAGCQRRRGATDDARRSLDQALQLCRQRGLEELRSRVLQEQATLLADLGDYRGAYERHREFHTATEAIFSLERDARARVLATVFETEQAVRSSNRFRELSLRDPLTTLYNRRYVDDRLPALLRRATLEGTDLCVAVVDLDFFKNVNDQLSHDTGDEVLRRMAPLLGAHAPSEGFAARLGGEEFLLAMPRHGAAAGLARCERLRVAVREAPWSELVGDLRVTVSIGIGVTRGGAASAGELLANADRRLYAAKRSGRDRVVGPPTTHLP